MRLRRRLRRLLGQQTVATPAAPTAVSSAGGDGGRSTLRRMVQDRVRSRTSPVIAVLSQRTPKDLLSWVESARSGTRVHVWGPELDASQLHVAMAAAGPFDLIVDEQYGAGRAARIRATFFHLRSGGALVVRRAHDAASEPSAGAHPREMADLCSTLVRRTISPEDPPPRRATRDDDAMAGALTSLTVAGGHLELVSGARAAAKVREEELPDLLDLTGPEVGRVLVNHPGQVFTSRAVVQASPSEARLKRRSVYDVPDLTLREYHHALSAPGQVLTSGTIVLPDSFRHNQRPRVGNRHLTELGPRFTELPDPGEVRELAGSHFYLDSEFRGHFGHAMTEQLSRLWAWESAKAIRPDLKALLHTTGKRGPAEFERVLYGAVGIDPDDLVFVSGPVRVEHLMAATPMLSQPEYVHPDIQPLWARVSASLASGAPPGPRPARIFCARRHAKRACHNADEVEKLFADHGFEIIFPEDFSLHEQAALFREAEVIGGFAGSALFNLVFSHEPKHVVMIASESYTAQNEYLLAAVVGHRIDLARCVPDVPATPGRWSRASFHSDFTFDMDREGRFVREVLGALPAP